MRVDKRIRKYFKDLLFENREIYLCHDKISPAYFRIVEGEKFALKND